jgi:hypothetical protein
MNVVCLLKGLQKYYPVKIQITQVEHLLAHGLGITLRYKTSLKKIPLEFILLTISDKEIKILQNIKSD